MQSTQSGLVWLRFAPWAGIAFAILFVAGFLISGDTPEYDDAAEWEEYLNDSDKLRMAFAGGLMMLVSALALIWYSQALVWRLKSDSNPLGQIAGAAATVMVVMLMTAVFFGIGVPAAIEIGDTPVPDVDFAIQFESVAFGMLMLGTLWPAAVFTAAVTTLARGTWPKWLIWTSYILAVVMLFGLLFIPLIALPLWALITGIYLLRKPL